MNMNAPGGTCPPGATKWLDNHNWRWWVCRFYVLPLLRLRHRVVQITRGPARMYCIGCDHDEVGRVTQLPAGLLCSTAARVARYLDVPGPTPVVGFLCFGRAVSPSRVPLGLRSVLRDNEEACWWPTLWAVVLNLRGIGESAERLHAAVIHEFAHALMTVLGRPYVYPRTIHEAFAVSFELELGGAGAQRPCPWRRALLGTRPTVRALLAAEDDVSADGSFHDASLALFAFLATLNRSHGGVLDNWLAEIRRLRLDGEGTYSWVQRQLNWDEAALETAFARFLASGEIPAG